MIARIGMLAPGAQRRRPPSGSFSLAASPIRPARCARIRQEKLRRSPVSFTQRFRQIMRHYRAHRLSELELVNLTQVKAPCFAHRGHQTCKHRCGVKARVASEDLERGRADRSTFRQVHVWMLACMHACGLACVLALVLIWCNTGSRLVLHGACIGTSLV